MEPEIEYFYGEALRWSFGFENPNKAAVIFACLIPLFWFLWNYSWGVARRMIQIPALLLSASFVLGAAYCLSMTYSRGGLVAASAGLAYMGTVSLWQVRPWLERKRLRFSAQVILSITLIAIMLSIVIVTGLGERSLTALGNDRSVGNRFDLWGGALQMVAENPRGFGAGKSGEQYMEWYQSIDRKEGYRTMVNSYLTFLVERGWFVSLGLVSIFLIFWNWTRAKAGESFTNGLRGCLVAFFTTAFFSTTMEEARLWILPSVCLIMLIILAFRKRTRICSKSLIFSSSASMGVCLLLYIYGIKQMTEDPLQREFARAGKNYQVSAIAPKNESRFTLGCLLDPDVVGAQNGKLLRDLAIRAKVKLILGKEAQEPERILIMGNSINSDIKSERSLYLLAPRFTSEKRAQELFLGAKRVYGMLPEIDEDGSLAFWEDLFDDLTSEHDSFVYLSGVGTRVDWAWEEVIEMISQSK